MMQLNVSKRTMMRLIREHKDQIGVPIPQPNCKEVRFDEYPGGHRVFWRCEGTKYEFVLTFFLNLCVDIRSEDGLFYMRKAIPLDRDFLIGMGILVEREEGFACQG